MKLAGPPAMMDVLLPTNRPAPMLQPIEIMVRWRRFKERESSFFPVGSAGFDTVISGTSMDERASYPASTWTRGSPNTGTVGPPHSWRSRIHGRGYAGCGLSNSRASRWASQSAWFNCAGALQSPMRNTSCMSLAALGLHPAQMGLRSGPLGSGPRAVRGLPESIAGVSRANLDRFEQYVVLRVAGHDSILSFLP